jgi:putative phosphoesterase
MKIIALGDIHGNLPALEVALREARAEGYDLICHTGDVVGYAPFPKETVALLRQEGIAGVRGNVDLSLAAGAEEFGPSREPPEVEAFQRRAYEWTARHADRFMRGFLSDLPFEERLAAGDRRAVLVHGTPIDAFTALGEDRDDDFFREMGDLAAADIIICGHTHRPYHRVVDGRHFVNAGSVGFPRDGDPRTGYAVIRTNGNVEVRFQRYPYDINRLLGAAADRGFPADQARRVFLG